MAGTRIPTSSTGSASPETPPPKAVVTPGAPPAKRTETDWTFLTNHAHVLLCIAQQPEARMRDVAARVGITERAVQRIISDLEGGGYLARIRSGRRNQYEIRMDLPLRHPIEKHAPVSDLIALVSSNRT